MKIWIGIIAVLAGTLQAATPSDTCKQETWVTNGFVDAIVKAGNTIYIGGSFTRVGPYTGGGVPIGISSGSALGKFPKINGTVNAACSDSKGGWFVGGIFTKVDGIALNNLAHIFSNGNVDASWNPNPNSSVDALVVSGSKLYVGGYFTNIGGKTRNYIAALDATTGNTSAWNADANNVVSVLAVSGSMCIWVEILIVLAARCAVISPQLIQQSGTPLHGTPMRIMQLLHCW